MIGSVIGIKFIVFVVARALLGKDDSDGPKGPPWNELPPH